MARKPRDWRRYAPASKTVRADGTATLVRYSRAVCDEICRRIAGGEVWHRIANTGSLPAYETLYAWRRKHPEFAEALAQAREAAAELRADQALLAAEEATPATVQVDRLKVAAYQWRAAKSAPKLYGPKAGEEAEGGGEPRRMIIEIRRFEKVTNEDGKVVLREVFPEGQDPERRGRGKR